MVMQGPRNSAKRMGRARVCGGKGWQAKKEIGKSVKSIQLLDDKDESKTVDVACTLAISGFPASSLRVWGAGNRDLGVEELGLLMVVRTRKNLWVRLNSKRKASHEFEAALSAAA
ncbi:hypothetical protein B0H14DRAFT_2602755 [Mycena olivaceomarginata]|nr:hypothetical protein B0H14DRAFT_2602755 [Mycena olivaceomarginata]